MKVILPNDFDDENYKDLKKLLLNLKDQPYSLYSVDKILDQIDLITTNEEFRSSKAFAQQNIISDKLNIDFIVEKSETFVVEKIPIAIVYATWSGLGIFTIAILGYVFFGE